MQPLQSKIRAINLSTNKNIILLNPEDLDTLITDFMKSHDEELWQKWLDKHCPDCMWGIEKRREQAEWLIAELWKQTTISREDYDRIINKAFGLEPEKLPPIIGATVDFTDPETQSQLCGHQYSIERLWIETKEYRHEIADLKKRVEALEKLARLINPCPLNQGDL